MVLMEFLNVFQHCRKIRTVGDMMLLLENVGLTSEALNDLRWELTMYETIAPFTPIAAAIDEITDNEGLFMEGDDFDDDSL